MAKKQTIGLGKGLNEVGIMELLGRTQDGSDIQAQVGGEFQEVAIETIAPNPYQPRKNIVQEKVDALALSIKQHGILQPVLLRRVDGDETTTHELIAGQMRLLAAKKAGMTRVPAIVKSVDDSAAMCMAMIENLQRSDINPIDQAMGYEALMQQGGMTHQMLAEALGVSRSAVTNALRLLQIADPVKRYIIDGVISSGHARCLLPLPAGQQIALCEIIIAKKLSVREAERRVQALQSPFVEKQKSPITKEIGEIERRLITGFQAQVKIQPQSDGRGRIIMQYHSMAQLRSWVERLGKDDISRVPGALEVEEEL
jgi:ParB family transcriptional regulator, chromosome partitioning protein